MVYKTWQQASGESLLKYDALLPLREHACEGNKIYLYADSAINDTQTNMQKISKHAELCLEMTLADVHSAIARYAKKPEPEAEVQQHLEAIHSIGNKLKAVHQQALSILPEMEKRAHQLHLERAISLTEQYLLQRVFFATPLNAKLHLQKAFAKAQEARVNTQEYSPVLKKLFSQLESKEPIEA